MYVSTQQNYRSIEVYAINVSANNIILTDVKVLLIKNQSYEESLIQWIQYVEGNIFVK